MSNNELGIIATIQKFLDEVGIKPFTHEDILAALVEKFPDRNPDKMMATVKTQIPGKMDKERGYKFRKEGQQLIAVPPKKA